MKLRILIGVAMLFVALSFAQPAQASGGDRIRYWIENTVDGCANIYIYVYTPYDWPYLSLDAGYGDEAPLSAWDVQPKYVCPFKNKGLRHVNYTLWAKFRDGTVEVHNFYYDVNGSFPTRASGCPNCPTVCPPACPTTSFYANPPNIFAGQCTLLRWDIDYVSQIYFNGQGVTGHETRTVCPYVTSSFTLRVIRYDGSEYYPTVWVYVTQGPPPPPECGTPYTPVCSGGGGGGEFPPPDCGTPYTPPCGGGGGGGGGGEPYVIETLMNLNSYCAYKYGSSSAANFTNFNDAYTWGCYNGSYRISGIDMNDVCRVQHPEAPNPRLKDRNNAYSWVCSNR